MELASCCRNPQSLFPLIEANLAIQPYLLVHSTIEGIDMHAALMQLQDMSIISIPHKV